MPHKNEDTLIGYTDPCRNDEGLDILKQLVKEELIFLFVDFTTISETVKRVLARQTGVCRETTIRQMATVPQPKKPTTETSPIQVCEQDATVSQASVE